MHGNPLCTPLTPAQHMCTHPKPACVTTPVQAHSCLELTTEISEGGGLEVERQEGGTAWPQCLATSCHLDRISQTVEVRSHCRFRRLFSDFLGFVKLCQGPRDDTSHGEEASLLPTHPPPGRGGTCRKKLGSRWRRTRAEAVACPGSGPGGGPLSLGNVGTGLRRTKRQSSF